MRNQPSKSLISFTDQNNVFFNNIPTSLRGKQIRQVQCVTALSPSRLMDVDYLLNPYTGCEYGCKYCYAQFMSERRKSSSELVSKSNWGGFVDIKTNFYDKLLKDLLKHSIKGTKILISSVTDPYQPIEKIALLTKRTLIALRKKHVSVMILTKSPLVLRDISIISQEEMWQVGMSINTFNEKVRKIFEPNASALVSRILTLQRLALTGIHTYAYLAPIYPFTSYDEVITLIQQLSFVDYIIIDKLNPKYSNMKNLQVACTMLGDDIYKNWIEAITNLDRYYLPLKRYISSVCPLSHKIEFLY